MAKKILFLCLFFSLIFPSTAIAEENIVTSVKKGDTIPCDGILLSLDAAAKVLNDKRLSDSEYELRLEYELNLPNANYSL